MKMKQPASFTKQKTKQKTNMKKLTVDNKCNIVFKRYTQCGGVKTW